MEIHSSFNGMNLTLTLKGHITGITEVTEIKNIVTSHQDFQLLELIITDAFVIPSALIGYLVKVTNVDQKKITIQASQNELKTLLSELNLDKMFTVR